MMHAMGRCRLCTGLRGAFHRLCGIFKGTEYLLITHSFPHSPQDFPQELSTGTVNCGKVVLVHITHDDGLRRICHFFAGVDFDHGGFFVQKITLDKEAGTVGSTVKKFKKGG